MTSHELSDPASRDALRDPLGVALWWGLPLVAGWSAEVLPISPLAETLVWAAALTWMGTGCVVNARRCHRLHCYISAPVLLLGATAVVLAGLGWTPLGPHTASDLVNGSLGLALLSCLAEPIWGRYRSR